MASQFFDPNYIFVGVVAVRTTYVVPRYSKRDLLMNILNKEGNASGTIVFVRRESEWLLFWHSTCAKAKVNSEPHSSMAISVDVNVLPF